MNKKDKFTGRISDRRSLCVLVGDAMVGEAVEDVVGQAAELLVLSGAHERAGEGGRAVAVVGSRGGRAGRSRFLEKKFFFNSNRIELIGLNLIFLS